MFRIIKIRRKNMMIKLDLYTINKTYVIDFYVFILNN